MSKTLSIFIHVWSFSCIVDTIGYSIIKEKAFLLVIFAFADEFEYMYKHNYLKFYFFETAQIFASLNIDFQNL